MKEIQKNSIDPLKVAWSRKWAILLFTLTVTVATFFTSTFIPNLYESKATVLIAPPLFDRENPTSFFSIDSYKDLAMTSGILQGTIDRLEPKYPDIKNSLYPETLENMVSIETGVTKYKGGQSKSALISFKVTGRDPNLIKDIANTMANLLSEASKQMRIHEVTTIAKAIQTHYIATKDALDKLEKTANKVRIKNHLGSVMENLEIKQFQLRKFEYKLMKINIELIGEESKLSTLMKQSIKYSDMVTENLLTSQTKFKSLVATQKFTIKSVNQLKKEILQLEEMFHQRSSQEKKLNRQIKALEQSLIAQAERLEETQTIKSEKTSDMRLISAAITPNSPIWPNKLQITLIAIIASLVVGMAIALAKEHLDNIN